MMSTAFKLAGTVPLGILGQPALCSPPRVPPRDSSYGGYFVPVPLLSPLGWYPVDLHPLFPFPQKQKSPLSRVNWWPRPGSNRRHTDFQSVALPTELPSHRSVFVNGRSRGIRTHDPVIKSHLLYQLSYAPIHMSSQQMERAKGLEPSTTTLARWHSTN